MHICTCRYDKELPLWTHNGRHGRHGQQEFFSRSDYLRLPSSVYSWQAFLNEILQCSFGKGSAMFQDLAHEQWQLQPHNACITSLFGNNYKRKIVILVHRNLANNHLLVKFTTFYSLQYFHLYGIHRLIMKCKTIAAYSGWIDGRDRERLKWSEVGVFSLDSLLGRWAIMNTLDNLGTD